MSNKKNTTAWIIRVVLFILFIVSAWTKIHDPIWMFEKQLVDLGICDWCLAHYLARLLIAFEFALGIALLFPHLLKKLVIPVTIGLLVAFCIHLSIQMIEFGPNNGNCGCFGTTIPMTPLEAFIKNVLTIGLLVWLYKLLPSAKEESWSRIIYPILIFLACALFLFMAYPFCPCKKKPSTDAPITDTIGTGINDDLPIIQTDDSLPTGTALPTADPNEDARIKDSITKALAAAEKNNLTTNKETTPIVKPEDKGPKAVKSKFAAYPTFSGKTIKVDEGKKTICLFAPGCDHCQNTAKMLFQLSKEGKTPPVYIYFMDEQPELIPEFFQKAGTKFPYQVLSIGDFWDLLGSGSTPGVFGLWNGNIQQSYEGIQENEFDLKKFKKFALPK